MIFSFVKQEKLLYLIVCEIKLFFKIKSVRYVL